MRLLGIISEVAYSVLRYPDSASSHRLPMHGSCISSICISFAQDTVRLNRTAPPRLVPRTWKLRLASRSVIAPAGVGTKVYAVLRLAAHYTPVGCVSLTP